MFEQYTKYIKEKTLEAYPLEAVFLITESGCYEVPNIAKNPKETFAVASKDIQKAMSEGLKAVVHSHPHFEAYPSEADMQTQLNYRIPFGLLATDGENTTEIVWWGDGVPTPDLMKRTFVFGVTDCYSFIRDYYKINLSIDLPEIPRDWDFWKKGKALFEDNTEKAGFVRVPDIKDIQKHDMYFCVYRARVSNHAGIYIGDGQVLHHQTSGFPIDASRHPVPDPLNRHKNSISGIYRHKALL
ncbi:NlpC/P60 family protein [Marinobacter salarius]|uniref:NlpC/P60 family protein n=1 Tax=Marinobacter salarius TaxID=1420917 RepID=UPI003BA94252